MITIEQFNSKRSYLQVIAAEGEQKASRALKEASEIISESSSALQLRYLQASINICGPQIEQIMALATYEGTYHNCYVFLKLFSAIFIPILTSRLSQF